MKKLTLILSFLFGLMLCNYSSTLAQSTKGDIEAGVGLAYASKIEQLGINANGYYTINEEFRAGLGLTYFFPEDVGYGSYNWFSININGNYIFYNEDELMAYALAGINITSFSYDYDKGYEGPHASSSETGLNIGAGLEYQLDFANLFGELKFAGLGGDADHLAISAGLRFLIN